MYKKPNFVFFGTPDVATGTLEILKQGCYMPALIITQPDKPQGRGMLVTPPPAKVWAEENSVPCLQPDKLDSDFISKLSTFNFQLALVVAYGKIIPQAILDIPSLGAINIHYSLLPRYRGASPVESAILDGETKTGVTIQQVVMEMDAGDILAQEEVEIGAEETAPELRGRLIKLGGEVLVKILPEFLDGKINPIPQDGSLVSVCKKIKKEDTLVDLEKESPQTLYNKYRAYASWPRIFFMKDGKRVIITGAKLIEGQLIIERVIPEGKKETTWEEFQKQK